jgi:hypothetical protein
VTLTFKAKTHNALYDVDGLDELKTLLFDFSDESWEWLLTMFAIKTLFPASNEKEIDSIPQSEKLSHTAFCKSTSLLEGVKVVVMLLRRKLILC